MACDSALMIEVLPGKGIAVGKDLGILNIATNVPNPRLMQDGYKSVAALRPAAATV